MKRFIGVRHQDTNYTLTLVKSVEIIKGDWVIELTTDTTQALPIKDEKRIGIILDAVKAEFKETSGYVVSLI